MKIERISFEDLQNIDDSHLIFTGLLVIEENYDDTIKAMSEFFIGSSLSTKNVVSLKRIDGNVLGDDGRHDYLITFEDGNKINPIVRVGLGTDVKWVSDFVINFVEDYVENF